MTVLQLCLKFWEEVLEREVLGSCLYLSIMEL